MQEGRLICCVIIILSMLWSQSARAYDPDANPGAVAAAAPPIPVAPVPGAPEAAAPAPVEPVVNAKPVSLFITPEELSRINEAIEGYKRMQENRNNNAENQAKNFLNQLAQPAEEVKAEPPKPVLFTYPQFFLQYLSYQGENEWLVIINGQKFIPGYNDPNSWLRMLSVSKEMVVMEWMPQDMEKIADSWMLASAVAGQNDVAVDSIVGKVTFTLRPNQTFSSYVMRVLEGKVTPTSVWIQPSAGGVPVVETKENKAAVVPAQTPAEVKPEQTAKPPAGEESPPAGENKEGLKGLSETYKKMGLEP